MNCLCIRAKEYLKNISDYSSEQVKEFIDSFNIKMQEYSLNGLSSFVLECIGVCINLSHSIGYFSGEAGSMELKGDILASGGFLFLAIESYRECLEISHNSVVEHKLNRARILLGDETLVNIEGEKTLLLLKGLIDGLDLPIESDFKPEISNQDDYLILSYYFRSLSQENPLKAKILEEIQIYTRKCHLCSIHLESLLHLPLDPESLVDLIDAAKNLFSKNHILIFIDFLLNISNELVLKEDFNTAIKIIQIAQESKRDIRIFDNRIDRLLLKTPSTVTI